MPWLLLGIYLVYYVLERSLQLGMMYVNQNMMPRFTHFVRLKFFRSTIAEFERNALGLARSAAGSCRFAASSSCSGDGSAQLLADVGKARALDASKLVRFWRRRSAPWDRAAPRKPRRRIAPGGARARK